MVVSIDIYGLLNIVQLIVCNVYLLFFIFFRRSETWNKILRLCFISVLLLINLFQIPMEVQLDKSYGLSIFLVILWFINALMLTFELGRDSH